MCYNINMGAGNIKNRGFTLIELLFSTAIVAMLFISIHLGFQLSRRTSVVNKHREEAIIYLQNTLEYLKSLNYQNMVSVYSTKGPNYNWPSTDPLFNTLNIYVEEGAAYSVYNSSRIIARVSWTEFWGQKFTEQMETIRYKEY